MQLYVPGARLSRTFGVPSGRGLGEPSPVHWIVAEVGFPGASDSKLTVTLDSGVSLNEIVSSFPLPHVAALSTVTLCVVVSSILYPLGALVSLTL